jgi:3-oxoacyl-[acyl-carrier protein] reductase
VKPLQDKVAIITGASQGIGLETALEMARRGAVPILVDINSSESQLKLVRAIEARARGYAIDVSKKDEWIDMVQSITDQFGRMDILVNNAAISGVKPFEEIPEAEWDRVFAVNVKGVLFGCQTVSGLMRRQKSGRIVNMASQAGKTGGLLIGAHYSASKAAVICMTKTFAAALAPDNITVNAVSPGIIKTQFLEGVPGIESFFSRVPLGQKAGEAIDVARAIAFLASEDARYITGEILDVNGGLLMD